MRIGLAHLAALTLVSLDFVIRCARTRSLLRACGSRTRWREVMAFSAFGEAAAIVTPWRAGGEVARLAGARSAGIPGSVAAAVFSIEMLVVLGTSAAAGAWLAATHGAAWAAAVGESLTGSGANAQPLGPILAAAAVVALVVLLIASPVSVRSVTHRIGGSVASAVAALRRLRAVSFAVCVGLSALSLAARVLVLVVLAAGLQTSVEPGAVITASFLMLHGQLAAPTPAGLGPVELAVLSGAAGLGSDAALLLAAWRLHITVVPLVAGGTVGAAYYGLSALVSRAVHEEQRPS